MLYVFFRFLFAFLCGRIEGRVSNRLAGVAAIGHEAERQYRFVGIGAQSQSGYGRAHPAHCVTEGIAAFQPLLGAGFLVTWDATLISRLGNKTGTTGTGWHVGGITKYSIPCTTTGSG